MQTAVLCQAHYKGCIEWDEYKKEFVIGEESFCHLYYALHCCEHMGTQKSDF